MIGSHRLLVAGRVLAGLSQQELATEAHVALSVVRAIEQGKSDPKLSTVRALVSALREHEVEILVENHRSLGGLRLLKHDSSADAVDRR